MRRAFPWRTVIITVSAICIIRVFLFQTYAVPSSSMRRTLEPGDVILADKTIYGYRIPFLKEKILKRREPLPDDILIFKYGGKSGRTFVKRCIAIGGQTVLIRDKNLFVDGRRVASPPCAHPLSSDILPATTDQRDNFGPLTVPAGEFFCMGDNWEDSRDSRYRGTVLNDGIIARAAYTLWSWNTDVTVPWYNVWQKIRWGRTGIRLQ